MLGFLTSRTLVPTVDFTLFTKLLNGSALITTPASSICLYSWEACAFISEARGTLAFVLKPILAGPVIGVGAIFDASTAVCRPSRIWGATWPRGW